MDLKLEKKLTSRVSSQKEYVKNYVTLMSGMLRLTDTELLVLTEIVLQLHKGSSREIVFSPEGRADIRKELKMSSQKNFNNFLMSLKRKKAIIKYSDGYDINPYMYPRDEITFKFEVNEKLN